MPQYDPHEEAPDLTDLLPPKSAPTFPVARATELSDAVVEAIAQRQKLADEASTAQEVWSRSSEKRQGESDQAHQDRIKAEFEAAVMAVRRQESAPPLPPQPVPRAISEQTKREMAAGARQSAYWKEQQKLRPMPNAKEIQAAGVNTPVFRPGEFMHEKGGVEGKNLVTQYMPVR